jgi:hypothetical protein
MRYKRVTISASDQCRTSRTHHPTASQLRPVGTHDLSSPVSTIQIVCRLVILINVSVFLFFICMAALSEAEFKFVCIYNS